MNNRLISCILISSMVLPMGALAKEPVAKYDEAMYVNLDYYGSAKNASVVKSYELNGAKQIVDFGAYSDIVNMTNYIKPISENNKNIFKFEDTNDLKRFYFEGKIDEQNVNLPWDFDVSYKLNGADAFADDLAGAQGLVEINVHVTPIKETNTYYRNNMMLQVGTVVNTDDVISVEAPGAQIASVGSRKAIIFFALPGEEQTFTIRIGSDDFEFSGLAMAMMPITLSQLEDITELRETKEKIEDSSEAMNESLDVVLNTLEGMQSSLAATSNGLKDLDGARGTISNGKGEVYANADKALESLDKLSKDLEPTLTHLENAKTLITDTNTQINKIVELIKGTKTDLENIKTVITKSQKDIKAFQDMIADLSAKSEERRRLFSALDDDLSDLTDYIRAINDRMTSLKSSCDTFQKHIASLQKFPTVPSIPMMSTTGDPQMDALIPQINASITTVNGMVTVINGANDIFGVLAKDTGALLQSTSSLLKALTDATDDQNIMYTLRDAAELLEDYIKIASAHLDDANSLLEHTNELGDISKNMIDTGNKTIDEIVVLNDVLNKHEPNLQQALTDSKTFTQTAITGIGSTHTFLTSFKSLMKTSGGQIDSGTQKTLNGLIGVLQQSISGLAQTPTIRNAKDTIKTLVDDEWDKYTEESTVLNIDPTLSPISFTSQYNEAPESIQVILRTEEITKPDDDGNIDGEPTVNHGNVFTRVGDIFRKIWDSITGIFK